MYKIQHILIFTLLLSFVVFSNQIGPKKKQYKLNEAESNLNKYIIRNSEKTVVGNKIIFKLSFIRSSNFFDKKFHIKKTVNVELFFKTKSEFQFVIRDTKLDNFEMPKQDPFPYDHEEEEKHTDILTLDNDYKVVVEQKPFSITIMRSSTGEVLFSTAKHQLIFMKDYLELTTNIPSENMYGFGERSYKFKLDTGIYTLYNRDQFGVIEDGKGGKNLYGSHPMYLMREKSGNFHVSYLRNTMPMDIHIDMENLTLKYRILGGIFDFNFFVGDKNPETSIKLYHKYLGGYLIPPFWAMGFHQSRWGYTNLDTMETVLENYKKNDIPLDTIWSDIDYMQNKQPWTVDEYNFPIQRFNQMLKKYNKNWVMIVEPAVSTKTESQEVTNKAKQMDILIKNGEGKLLYNRVWPGMVNFLDFFVPETDTFWEYYMKGLHSRIPFRGAWLDMNELATFAQGQVDEYDNTVDCNDSMKYMFYPGNVNLKSNTICPNALHARGKYIHYQIHNYYPVGQAKSTFKALETLIPDENPFVLTRASAPGFGRWANHWSGDNKSNYEFLKLSITLTFGFNMFGNAFTGADICGFGEHATEELCAKFYQVGSLYPFSRSHSHNDSNRKEPFAMDGLLLETSKASLKFRYKILKFYYSLFLLGGGYGTIFRPVFFEFYEDEYLIKDSQIDTQFMIGSALLVTPLLTDLYWDNMNQYFPKGDWYDLRDNSKVLKDPSSGASVKVKGRLRETAPIFLRGGKTIFTNEVDKVENSSDLNNKFNLLIALSADEYDSTGSIPALTNYNSRSKSNLCLNGNCFIDFYTKFNPNEKILDISFRAPKVIPEKETKITILSLVIYGIDTSVNKFSKTSLDGQISQGLLSKDNKYEIKEVNQFVWSLTVGGTLTLDLKNPLPIRIEFK